MKEVIIFLEILINHYGVPEKLKSDSGSAFKSEDNKEFSEVEKIWL